MNRKADLKKTGDELQAYLQFRRRVLKLKTVKAKAHIHENRSTKIKRDIVLNMAPSD